MINNPPATKRDVTMLREWIARPDLGGIAFSGDDLDLNGKSVYDAAFLDDLTIIHNRSGENDPLTKLLAGPVFDRCERVLRLFRVSQLPSSCLNMGWNPYKI